MKGAARPRSWMATLMVLLAGCSASGTAPATSATTVSEPAPTRTVIVFERGFAEEAEIVSLDPVTLEAQVLSEAGQAHVPAVNEAGTDLAWAGPSETDPTWPDTFVRNLTTGDTHRVGSGAGPTWSHDQEALLVARQDGLYRMELDGSASRLVAGRELAGLEYEPGEFVTLGEAELGSRLGIEGDGGSATVYQADDCGSADWDVDADTLLLVFDVSCDEEQDERNGLYLHDLEAGTTDQLISASLGGASWAPDGESIVTVHQADRDRGHYELWMVDSSGTVIDTIAQPDQVSWPVWAELEP